MFLGQILYDLERREKYYNLVYKYSLQILLTEHFYSWDYGVIGEKSGIFCRLNFFISACPLH